MSEYYSSSLGPYHKRQWIYDSSQQLEPLWLQRLYEWLDLILKETFIESSYIDAIDQNLYQEDFTRNAATIESSLFRLTQYIGIEVFRPDEVVDYLLRYRGIYDATLYACLLTAETFPQNAHISIELYHDPEISDEYITIYVRQDHYDPDIIEKIDTICREYEPALEGQNAWILVTTDFGPPRS